MNLDKRKILLIVPRLSRGGQERAALRIAAMLCDMFEPVIATLHTTKNEYDCPFARHDFAFFRDGLSSFFPLRAVQILFAFLAARRKLRRFVKENDFLLSMSFGWMANCVNILSRRKNKVLVSVRNSKDLHFSARFTAFLRHFYRKADLIVCLSEGIQREMPSVYKLSSDRFVTLYNPFNIEQIKIASNEKPAYNFSSPTIASVGRLSEQKGFDVLLHAFCIITKTVPTARLVLVGGGPLENKLKALAESLGVSGAVTFCGVQANPFSILAQCDVFACSSYYEGLSNVIIEAMICGLPVVSVDCEYGPREILAPNSDTLSSAKGIELAEYGVLTPRVFVDKGVSEQQHAIVCLAKAIEKILSDERTASHYRTQARLRVADFGENVIRERFLAILSTLDIHR